jgi:hypothetical protein
LDVLPLTGAATTEIRGVHIPFFSPVFYPIRFWNINYFDALTGLGTGTTRLAVTPAQFQSDPLDPQRGVLRQFGSLDFRLYYSNDTQTYGGDSTPALAAAPTIVRVSAAPNPSDNSVAFSVNVVGNPAVGVQEVWVTYTDIGSPGAGTWESLDLIQSDEDSTLWESADPQSTLTLPPGANPCSIRYLVQAVNGVGLVTLETNMGAHFNPCAAAPTEPTALDLELLSENPGTYGSLAHFRATLTANGTAVDGKLVIFNLGSQVRIATTDANGEAEVQMPLLGRPDPEPYAIRASFFGSDVYQPAFAAQQFTIQKAATILSLAPDPAQGHPSDDELIVATLTDEFGRPLNERKTVFFVVAGGGGTFPVVTDPAGQAILGDLPLPPGLYSVTAYFNGDIPGVTTPGNPLSDVRYEPATPATVVLELVNSAPVCDAAYTDPVTIWPQDKEFHSVNVLGVTDPDGDDFTITIDSIYQDEPVGSNKFSPDGQGIGTDTAWLRAERAGNGDGRVYHIGFTATDGNGGACSVVVVPENWNPDDPPWLRVAIVPHDQGGSIFAIDGGPLYDATVPD